MTETARTEPKCRVCGVPIVRAARSLVTTCERHRFLRRDLRAQLPIVDKVTRYEDDIACQLFVATFPDGATLDMIAQAIGVSRERVRQIETIAFAKLRGQPLPDFDDGDEDDEGARHDGAGEAPPDEDPDEEADDTDDVLDGDPNAELAPDDVIGDVEDLPDLDL
jgi:hypothetical protein